MTVDEVRESANFAFHMPRRLYGFETAGVHVAFPTFGSSGSPDGYRSSLEVPGKIEEHPDAVMVRIPLKVVHAAIAGIPATYPSWILKSPKSTQVTFTPFFRIKSDV